MEVVEARGLPSDLEWRVMAAVKAAEERGDPPLLRAVEAARCFQECGLGIPSTELARVLVSNLCFANNNPSLWKLLDQAMASRVVSPFHTIALLMPRVIPCRREQPEAYRLYLELLTRYALSSLSLEAVTCRDKITKAIDDAMKLSETYKVQEMDFGHVIILFYFSIISSLIDCSIEDCSCLLVSADKYGSAFVNGGKLATELDVKSLNEKINEHRDHLRQSNALMAIEVAEKVTSNKKSKAFLRLISINMPERFNDLLRRLKILDANISTTLPSRHVFDKLSTNIKKAISKEFLLDKHKLLGALVNARSCSLNSSISFGAGKDACWIPIDIFMENAMDGKNLYAVSAVEILAELTKTLQEINQASWQETFQALWVSALRLIQRDREPLEGPVPHLDARLCMLLSIVPLTIAAVVKEEDEGSYLSSNSFVRMSSHGNKQNKIASRSHGLISSLQILGQFAVLLSPPPSVANAANNAATKAAIFVSNLKSGNSNPNGGRADSSIKAVGNMLHLIVEACIARNLIDTSAYFWPGYIVPSALSKDSTSFQESPWSTFLKGAPLTNSLKNSLMMTPASSLPEVDKMYQIAVNGTDEEKSAAAKILCSASLVRGWNIQEHVVHFVFKLLTLPPDSSASGARNHFIDHMPVLSAVLFGVCCVDTVHILSLYGMIPEVAAALMPLCETFGSLSPLSTHRSNNSEEISVYSVFSCAFLFLLRLWKFYKPSQEYCVAGREGSVRMELTLDYLLLMRNSRIALQNSSSTKMVDNNLDPFKSLQSQPVYIDSFPKLRAWYFQNQACIASTLSGMCSNNPAHQVANMILNMVYGKTSKGESVSGNSTPNTSSSINVSTITTTEESYQRPMVPAWDILEAVPFVLEAILTACAHGRLSSRDLTTGLRDLVDFLPASLATIISYFSAEITRGIWKPVPMNGTDWPSPAPTLLSIESEIKEILASAGVHIKSSYPHGLPPMLPLPMAALVSLTITFKLDKSLEYINGIAGQALENCATASTWPSMPIIGALWAQKVRRWHDFIVLSCSRSPFSTEKDAIIELIRSCFSSFLGPLGAREPQSTTMRGVAGLLGQFMADQGVRLPIAPGFLYLRTCRNFHSPHFFNEVIFKLVIEYAHKLAIEWGSGGPARLKSSRTSLATAALGIQEAATLGASLLFIAGGVQLVQVVYEETVPTLLLSPDEAVKLGGAGPILNILLGYALAYMLILCGALVWGFGNTCPHTSVFSARRARVIGIHMDLIAGGMEGTIMLGCDPATWKAYVLCFVGLMVNFAPAWIPEVKQETLHKLASGLKGWQECDLALSLLELGGPPSMTAVVESVL